MKVQTYAKVLATTSVATLLVYYVIQGPSLLRLHRPIGTGLFVGAPAPADVKLAILLDHSDEDPVLTSRAGPGKPLSPSSGDKAGLERWSVDSVKAAQRAAGDSVMADRGRESVDRWAKYAVSASPAVAAKSEHRGVSSARVLSAARQDIKRRDAQPEPARSDSFVSSLLAHGGLQPVVKPSDVMKSGQLPEAAHCPRDAVLTINPGGRLGNKLCRYLTVWILAQRIPNAQVRIQPPTEDKLNYYFSGGRQVATLSDTCSSAVFWRHVRLGENATFPRRLAEGQSLFIDGGTCPLSWFYPRRASILAELRWSPNITREVERRLALVPPGTQTLVSVHVRRGDYGAWLQKRLRGRLVSPSYLHCALKLARRRYPRAAFLVASDDMTWCRRNIVDADDVLFVGSNASAAIDLATLAGCDHSIVTYGTFGYVAAFMAGGDVVVPTGFAEREYPLPAQLEMAGVRVTRLPDTVNC